MERRAIFRDDTDRQNFLRRLEAVAEEEDLAVFAYVLMDNHLDVVARRQCRPGRVGEGGGDGARHPCGEGEPVSGGQPGRDHGAATSA